MLHEFTCSQCKEHKTQDNPQGFGGTGYAQKPDGAKICYRCCGVNDEVEMMDAKVGTRFTMYLTGSGLDMVATNWCGTFTRPIKANYRTSPTNWGLKRTDVWFKIQGECFWGYSIGENTQILHVRKIKT